MLCRFPACILSAIRSTANLAVLPVPSPSTMPDSIKSTAWMAALFFNSSCESNDFLPYGFETTSVVGPQKKLT
jgi:hypothetical protein